MADEIYFFTHNYAYDADAVASTPGSSVGGHTPDQAIDNHQATYWETIDAAPQLKIDMGAAQTIDSLWFKSANVAKYRLYYSTDGITYTAAHAEQDGNANGYNWHFSFTPGGTLARYWRLDITQELVGGNNTLIYEILLMQHRLTLDDDDSWPSRVEVIPTDRAGGSYALADGSVTSFVGDRARVDIEMTFEYTPLAERDNLYTLYSTPTLRPTLTIFPDDNYQQGIYQVIWQSIDFPLVYQMGYKGSGFGGMLKFQEW